jgi:hypothetical protein
MAESPKPLGAGAGSERQPGPPPPSTVPAAGALAPDADRNPDQRLRAALEASTRAEASLSALMRAVEQVTTGVSGAQEANERLTIELATARRLLAEANDQRVAQAERAAELAARLRRTEQALVDLRNDSERERQFIIEEQDRFLAGLLAEHDEAVAALRRELEVRRGQSGEPVPGSQKKTLPGIPRGPEPAPELATLRAELGSLQAERQRSRELLRRVQAQRDEAQETVSRLTREREEAKAELARQTGLHSRRTDPQPWKDPEATAAADQRATAPPDALALEAALLASRKPSPPSLPLVEPLVTVESGMAGPPPTALLRKHDPRRRALGSYSIRPEEVEPERVAARPDSKPPRG